MKLVDVLQVTRDAIAQSMGANYGATTNEQGEIVNNFSLEGLSTYELVDVGRDVVDSGSVEKFTNALVSLLSTMYVESRAYETELKSMSVDYVDWGWFKERIKIDLADIDEALPYTLSNGRSYAKEEHTFYQPKVTAKIFEEAKAIQVRVSFTEAQLKEAFNSYAQLNTFISGIREQIKQTIDIKTEAYRHALICSGIAISTKATKSAIHLLSEAKAKGIVSADTTAEQALENVDALRYFVKRIKNTRAYMARRTEAFNNKTSTTFTPYADNKLALLMEFETNVKFNLLANTYNDELIGIGDYDSVSSWQGITSAGGNTFDFSTISSVKISADLNNKLGCGTEAINISNVVAFAYDKMAIGYTIGSNKTTSNYTASADFWNEYSTQLCNMLVDSSYNMVAFILD